MVALLESPPAGEEQQLLQLLEDRVPPGVDEAAYIKAGFLAAVSKGDSSSPLLTRQRAVELLGTMQGGYNIGPLVEALDDAELAPTAAAALSRTILVFDAFHDVEAKAKAGNAHAQQVSHPSAAHRRPARSTRRSAGARPRGGPRPSLQAVQPRLPHTAGDEGDRRR